MFYYLDLPSSQDIKSLVATRADACVSIYLKTTPLTPETGASVIELGNLQREANAQLEAVGFDKRRLAALNEQIDALREDEGFWRRQANSLAVLVTPDRIQTFRLANNLGSSVHVSDRFHLKPLLRAVTFPHSCLVLALSENAVRLVEVHDASRPQEIRIPGMPADAASHAGKSTLNDRSMARRIQGAEGQNVRFAQYARAVDDALRPVLSGYDVPLILAATGRLASVFPSVNSYPGLAEETIATSPDRLSEDELAALAQPILDRIYADEVRAVKALFKQRSNSGRAVTDLSDAARAATFGAIDTLMVDFERAIPGIIDEETGALELADEDDAITYGVVDEIAGRALQSGARVLSVRGDDLPDGAALAAILRFPI